jgi:GTP-binding protein
VYDLVDINISSGHGGDGAASFRREKYVPLGGPDGGDGGKGADVAFEVDVSMASLLSYRRHSRYRAEHGEDGRIRKQHGRDGCELILAVPPGTVVLDPETGAVLADLAAPGRRMVVARGGRGGRGNVHFTTSTNQAPRLYQKGAPGVDMAVRLEMRAIADVGIIGYPNAGKSTLLRAVSAAKPKVADYPFTTLQPELGMVRRDDGDMVIAEIPGLIEGAHLGKGLGHDFLRHVMRTRLLIHLVDGATESPENDLARLNVELSLFDTDLGRKPQVVAVNKIDRPEVAAERDKIAKDLGEVGIDVWFISAATGEGIDDLLDVTAAHLAALPRPEAPPGPVKVFTPPPRGALPKITQANGVYTIDAPDLARLAVGNGGNRNEIIWYIRQRLKQRGVYKALDAAGIEFGDKVRVGKMEWGWP